MKNKIIFIFLIFIFIKAGNAEEKKITGLYIEESVTTNVTGMELSFINKTYLTEDKALIADQGLPYKIIIDYKSQTAVIVNDTKKTRTQVPLKNLNFIQDHIFYSILSNITVKEIYIKESNNKKTIGRYDCFEVGILIPAIATISTIWLSKNTEVPTALYYKLINSLNTFIHLKKIMPLMEKNNAVPVSFSTIIVRENESNRFLNNTIKELSVKNIEENIFAVPDEYTKITFQENVPNIK